MKSWQKQVPVKSCFASRALVTLKSQHHAAELPYFIDHV
jgi:hypothetical protein